MKVAQPPDKKQVEMTLLLMKIIKVKMTQIFQIGVQTLRWRGDKGGTSKPDENGVCPPGYFGRDTNGDGVNDVCIKIGTAYWIFLEWALEWLVAVQAASKQN